ncbi:MAG: hypothetical protein QOF16_1355, partial [Actinomycetota bacterium]|nr:hypothetical protein [Actinomycetota bacterium]
MRQRALRWAAVVAVVTLGVAYGSGSALAAGNGHAYGHAKHGSDSNGTSHGSQKSSDHDGDADSSSSTNYTEDNDTNDGSTPNNQPDAGDNQHPSGKDRSVEHGNSGNQGKSESDPDDNGKGPDRSNGGPDKPNGSGGVDKADQDGNNGCGNDDDFEDDNEGWCGHHPKPDHSVCAESGSGTMPPGQAKKCEGSETVGGTDQGTDQCTEGNMIDSSECDTSGTQTGTGTEANVGGKTVTAAQVADLSGSPSVLGVRIVKGTIPAAVAAGAV